jgi:hypothetical protein
MAPDSEPHASSIGFAERLNFFIGSAVSGQDSQCAQTLKPIESKREFRARIKVRAEYLSRVFVKQRP